MDQTTFFNDSMVPKEKRATQGKAGLLSVEGIMMLIIASVFDLLGLACVVLILLFGVGIALGRVVSVCGFVVIGFWQFFRPKEASMEKKEKAEKHGAWQNIKTLSKGFFKKHWKKLVAEAFPGVGDVWPSFMHIVYSEFK